MANTQKPMPILQRAAYAFILSVVVMAVLSFVVLLGSADGIELLPESASALAFSPYPFVLIYVLALLVSPYLSAYVKIKRW